MEPDNTFSGIFGNKLSTPHKPEPIAQQEDTPAITDQTEADLTEDSGQKAIKEEYEPSAGEKTIRIWREWTSELRGIFPWLLYGADDNPIQDIPLVKLCSMCLA